MDNIIEDCLQLVEDDMEHRGRKHGDIAPIGLKAIIDVDKDGFHRRKFFVLYTNGHEEEFDSLYSAAGHLDGSIRGSVL